MVKKIISSCQTGAEQAALDFAIKLGIPHGGYAPKNRKSENRTLPKKYQLKEIGTSSYKKCMELNVIDSDGTLIISRGQLKGDPELTHDTAIRHSRPWIHVDLRKTNALQSAKTITSWIDQHGIEILYVTGSRSSKNPWIYQDTLKILDIVFHLGLTKDGMRRPYSIMPFPPRTVEQAVDRIISELSLRDKTVLANMREKNLLSPHFSMGRYIRNKFKLWTWNRELMLSCRSVSGKDDLDVDDASALLLRQLWKGLQKTHVLRVVKKTP